MKVRSNGGLVHVKFLRLLSAFLHLLERYTSCFKPLRLEIHVSSNVSKQRNLGVHNQFLFDRIFIMFMIYYLIVQTNSRNRTMAAHATNRGTTKRHILRLGDSSTLMYESRQMVGERF